MKEKGWRMFVSAILFFVFLSMMNLGVFAAPIQEESSSDETTEESTWNQKEGSEVKIIEAKVYLRYSNDVPENTLQSTGANEFGPAGNNTPYITVKVNLDTVAEKANHHSNGSWVYYSIDSDDRYNTVPNDNTIDRKKNADNFWKSVIYPAIQESDKQALDTIFGNDSFIGYVLKLESDGWHMDGVLRKDPPVYVVELYEENSNSVLFAISESGNDGVPYEMFKKYVEKSLDADSGNYEWVTEEDDNLVVKYQKDGVWYQSIITPRNNGEDENGYHVYPNQKIFEYRTVTPDIYFISRMKIKTEVCSGNLTISKTVEGSAANPKEHFIFTLNVPDTVDGDYVITYQGTESCENPGQHEETIHFEEQMATFVLKHGESATVQGLTGKVTVKENNEKYQTSYCINEGNKELYLNSQGVIVDVSGLDTTIAFENRKDAPPDTGVQIHIMPGCLAVLAGIGVGVVMLLSMKKRKRR